MGAGKLCVCVNLSVVCRCRVLIVPVHDSGLAQHFAQRLHLGTARVLLRKSTGRGGTKKWQACGAEGGEGPARRWRQIGDATAGVAGVLKSTSGRMCPSGGSQAADGGGGRQWRSITRRLPTLRPKRGMEEVCRRRTAQRQ